MMSNKASWIMKWDMQPTILSVQMISKLPDAAAGK